MMTIKKRSYLPCGGFLTNGGLALGDAGQKQNCNSVAGDCTASVFLVNSVELHNLEGTADLVEFFPNVSPALADLNESGGTWVMISPYGRHDHAQGMQVFEKEDAQTLVNEFSRWWNFGARKMGLPWYVGHPDHPAFAGRHTDTRAYGRIKKLEAREDGFWGEVFFSRAGKELVNERAYHGHSPNWLTVVRDGKHHPVSLRSVGFTNMPNIKVDSILHANQNNSGDGGAVAVDKKTKQTNKMITKIKELLLSIGKLKPGVDDDAVLGGVEALANENAQLQEAAVSAAAELEKQVALANEHESGATELTETKQALANERVARCELVVDKAISEGRLVIADREAQLESLANSKDFAADLTAVAEAKVAVKTGSVTGGLGGRNPNLAEKSLSELANERATDESPEAYQVAWNALKREFPERFEKQ